MKNKGNRRGEQKFPAAEANKISSSAEKIFTVNKTSFSMVFHGKNL